MSLSRNDDQQEKEAMELYSSFELTNEEGSEQQSKEEQKEELFPELNKIIQESLRISSSKTQTRGDLLKQTRARYVFDDTLEDVPNDTPIEKKDGLLYAIRDGEAIKMQDLRWLIKALRVVSDDGTISVVPENSIVSRDNNQFFITDEQGKKIKVYKNQMLRENQYIKFENGDPIPITSIVLKNENGQRYIIQDGASIPVYNPTDFKQKKGHKSFVSLFSGKRITEGYQIASDKKNPEKNIAKTPVIRITYRNGKPLSTAFFIKELKIVPENSYRTFKLVYPDTGKPVEKKYLETSYREDNSERYPKYFVTINQKEVEIITNNKYTKTTGKRKSELVSNIPAKKKKANVLEKFNSDDEGSLTFFSGQALKDSTIKETEMSQALNNSDDEKSFFEGNYIQK